MSYELYTREHQVPPRTPIVQSPTIIVVGGTPLPLPIDIVVGDGCTFGMAGRREEGRRFADFIYNIAIPSWRDAFAARLKAREAGEPG